MATQPNEREQDMTGAVKPFKLMDLPDEIYLMILRLALILPRPIPARNEPSPANELDWDKVSGAMALLQTCTKIRNDSLDLFLEKNTVEMACCLYSNLACYIFHKPITRSQRFAPILHHIKRFEITIHPQPNYTKNLEHHMDGEEALYDICDSLVTRLDLSQINLTINMISPFPSLASPATHDYDFQFMLETFVKVNGFRSVRVRDVEGSYAETIQTCMTDQRPQTNVWARKRYYEKWFNQWQDRWPKLKEVADDALSCFHYDDMEGLEEIRTVFIDTVRNMLTQEGIDPDSAGVIELHLFSNP